MADLDSSSGEDDIDREEPGTDTFALRSPPARLAPSAAGPVDIYGDPQDADGSLFMTEGERKMASRDAGPMTASVSSAPPRGPSCSPMDALTGWSRPVTLRLVEEPHLTGS